MQMAERESRAIRKVAYQAALVVMAGLLILTGTRGAYIAVLVQILLFAPLLIKNMTKKAVLVGGLVLLVIAINRLSVHRLVSSSDNFIYSGSIAERLNDYPVSVEYIKNKPLFGWRKHLRR
jgi:O-antigen ligase